MILLADKDFVTVSYDESLYMISVVWKPHPLSMSDYQSAFDISLDFQKDSKTPPVYNFISDIRNQTVVAPQYRKWFQETALPRAVEQGLRHGAVVTDAGIFKRYYLNHIMNTTKRFGLPLKLFKTPEAAHRWFKSSLDSDL